MKKRISREIDLFHNLLFNSCDYKISANWIHLHVILKQSRTQKFDLSKSLCQQFIIKANTNFVIAVKLNKVKSQNFTLYSTNYQKVNQCNVSGVDQISRNVTENLKNIIKKLFLRTFFVYKLVQYIGKILLLTLKIINEIFLEIFQWKCDKSSRVSWLVINWTTTCTNAEQIHSKE